ncbi:MAG: hypothetical protein IPJ88_01050 [Myxococcales bacterium]|nr:MAG: hypothetical protein IPJ88_01050 [Myxococcales bacterium]
MRKFNWVLFALLLMISSTAFAENTLTNQDEKVYRYTITCGENSASERIKPRMKTTIYSGDTCTLKVVGVGSHTITNNQECLIKGKSLTCKSKVK